MQNLFIFICICVVTADDPNFRIINGKPALTGEFPWQVSLQDFGFRNHDYGSRHFCGAAILTHEWIVTAAHCNKKKEVKAIVGTTLWNINASTHEVIARIVHPQGYDIMLMKVQPPFEFGRLVGAVCLPETDEEFEGAGTVAGWGSIMDDGGDQFTFPERLHAVNITLISDEQCAINHPEKFKPNINVCATNIDPNVNQGACYADSGGGLIAIARNKSLLVGIVSKHDGNLICGSSNNPGLYMNVAAFASWIKETINEDNVNTIIAKTPVAPRVKAKLRSLNRAKISKKYPC